VASQSTHLYCAASPKAEREDSLVSHPLYPLVPNRRAPLYSNSFKQAQALAVVILADARVTLCMAGLGGARYP
jgi:hypothetical protein